MNKIKPILPARFYSALIKFNQPYWIILIACFLAYGLMIPWLGLYSDDWIYLTSFHKFGSEGLTRYFSTNRPVWGMIYQVTLPLLGKTPWHWHVFGLFWHTAASITLWGLITLVWPKRKQAALWAGLLFAVYPGFVLQPISITFGHIFLVYTAYFLSVCFLILAVQQPKFFWVYSALALLTSVINLLCMEYFLLLHLLQPVVLWLIFQNKAPGFRQRLLLVIKIWWPYLLLFIGNLVWRTAFFEYQTNNYQYLFFDRLKNGIIPALVHLVRTMFRDWWNTILGAWVNVYKMPFVLSWDKIDILYLGLSLAAAVFFFFSLKMFSDGSELEPKEVRGSLQMLTLGILALVIAGGPFWLTELDVHLTGFQSRFSLPFIFGSVLVLVSLIQLIRTPRWMINTILAITLGLSIGYQLQIQNDFRREWIVQKNLLRQLAWRIPDLEPGTAIFMNEMPGSHHVTHTILSAMLDWNFQPISSSSQMDYAVYYPRELQQKLGISLQPGQDFRYDHLGSVFHGNTSQSITLQFSKGDTLMLTCVHVMSSSLDGNNPFLSGEEKSVALLSDPDLIKAADVSVNNHLFPEIFGREPQPSHCYYFEKADLAYQLGEWQLAIDRYSQDIAMGDSNWIDTELVPVIGSYAHLGDWETAYALTQKMADSSYYPVSPLICSLWRSLDQDTPDGFSKRGIVQIISDRFDCQY